MTQMPNRPSTFSLWKLLVVTNLVGAGAGLILALPRAGFFEAWAVITGLVTLLAVALSRAIERLLAGALRSLRRDSGAERHQES
jgi:hypothetical protein